MSSLGTGVTRTKTGCDLTEQNPQVTWGQKKPSRRWFMSLGAATFQPAMLFCCFRCSHPCRHRRAGGEHWQHLRGQHGEEVQPSASREEIGHFSSPVFYFWLLQCLTFLARQGETMEKTKTISSKRMKNKIHGRCIQVKHIFALLFWIKRLFLMKRTRICHDFSLASVQASSRVRSEGLSFFEGLTLMWF